MEQNTDLYDTLANGLDETERADTVRLMRENHREQLRILRARDDDRSPTDDRRATS